MSAWQNFRHALSRDITRDDLDVLVQRLVQLKMAQHIVLKQGSDGDISLHLSEQEFRFATLEDLAIGILEPSKKQRFARSSLVIEPPPERVFTFDITLPLDRDIRVRDVVMSHFSSFTPFAERETYWRIDKETRFAEGRRFGVSYTPRAPLLPLIDTLSRVGMEVSAIQLSQGKPAVFIHTPLRRLVLATQRHKAPLATAAFCMLLLAIPLSLSIRFDRVETLEKTHIAESFGQHRKLSEIAPNETVIAGLVDTSRPNVLLQNILSLAAEALPGDVELSEMKFESSRLSLRLPSASAEAVMERALSLGLFSLRES